MNEFLKNLPSALVTLIVGGFIMYHMTTGFSDLRAEFKADINRLENSITDFRRDLKEEMNELKKEFKAEMNDLSTELKADIAALDGRISRLDGDIDNLRKEIAGIRQAIAKIREEMARDKAIVTLFEKHLGHQHPE